MSGEQLIELHLCLLLQQTIPRTAGHRSNTQAQGCRSSALVLSGSHLATQPTGAPEEPAVDVPWHSAARSLFANRHREQQNKRGRRGGGEGEVKKEEAYGEEKRQSIAIAWRSGVKGRGLFINLLPGGPTKGGG